jgi:hypothetical protein
MAKPSPKNRRVLVSVKDYNGYLNVPFAFKLDDPRLSVEGYMKWLPRVSREYAENAVKNYENRIGEGTLSERGKVLTLDDGSVYTVHADGSLTEGVVRRVTMADHRAMEGN